MANTILTPVTLWKDFDDTLPLNEDVISERSEDGVITRDVYVQGRQTEKGRVKIYARFVRPVTEEKVPAIMILFEAGFPFDGEFVMRFVRKGYAVLCVDYCGKREGGYFTLYPYDIDYANYVSAGRRLDYCDDTARETSWYEWAAVARYAARYLEEREDISRFGGVGLRTGGEVLFKVAPYVPFSCMVSVCAAGWLAYRGIDKFSPDAEIRIFDEERHRFIAGIDSQSYAPYVKCPVLLLSAINDKKYNYDRVYDTFRQLNPAVEKAILFSSHGNGLIGSHSIADFDLFLEKYLKSRSVFLSDPIELAVDEDEAGNLVVRGTFDPKGEIKEYGIFYTENVSAFQSRDWTRVLGRTEDLEENVGTVPMRVFEGSDKALVYAFVNYSNNFSVTSKILEVNLTKRYANARRHSRVVYSEEDAGNGFSCFRERTHAIADCFMLGEGSDVRLVAGYGGITGATAPAGIITYRVGEARFEPPEGASFRFDAYAAEDDRLTVIFYKDEEEKTGYYAEIPVAGGGKWKSVLLEADDFKSQAGEYLEDFKDIVSVVFVGKKEVLVNNVLWI